MRFFKPFKFDFGTIIFWFYIYEIGNILGKAIRHKAYLKKKEKEHSWHEVAVNNELWVEFQIYSIVGKMIDNCAKTFFEGNRILTTKEFFMKYEYI